jgi:ferredoxin
LIVAEQKPLSELWPMIAPYNRVLILGCGTCMTVCDAGGEREVSFIDSALKLMQSRDGGVSHQFAESTIKRQCDPEFMDVLRDRINEFDCILSMGCGIGVQTLADKFPIPVLPGVNTSFMGAAQEQGVWDERCSACGDCRLDDTAGICPVTRCTKGILNGPCAGTKNGKCEANKDMDCAWILIYKRLEKLGQLEKMRRDYPMRNFRVIPRPRRLVKTSAGGAAHA